MRRRSPIADSTGRPRHGARVASVLLWVTAVGIFLSGVFDSDPIDVEEASTSGALHDLAGILGFIALMIAVFQLRRLFADSPGWASLAKPQLWFALGMLVLFLVMLFSPEDIVGISQRVFLIVTMTWLIVLSGWLSSTRLVSGTEQTT